MILGGAVAALGSLLPWVRVSTDRAASTVNGVSSGQGVVALVGGAILVLLGIAIVRGSKVTRGRAVAAMVVGVVAAAAAVQVIGSQSAQIDEGIRRHLRGAAATR